MCLIVDIKHGNTPHHQLTSFYTVLGFTKNISQIDGKYFASLFDRLGLD